MRTVNREKTVVGSILVMAVAGAMGVWQLDEPGRAGARTRGTEPTGAPEAKVTELVSKELKDVPGKEGLMITVEYPPGSVDPVHRHNAHSFIYLLEGSIVMQVKGGKEVTLKKGETFYEGPDDVHTVGRNASKTEPAKFVAFFVKEKGAPILVPDK